jgi:hypothetical protein
MQIAETRGENFAPSLITTRDGRLDLFFKLVRDVAHIPSSLVSGRHQKGNPVNHESSTAYHMQYAQLFGLLDGSWSVSKLDTMRIIFNWRDCRGGKGDYWGFYHALIHVIDIGYDWFAANLDCIPHYGRFLDLVILWHLLELRRIMAPNNQNYINAQTLIMNFLVEKLKTDKQLLDGEVKEDISLLAKWLPTEGGRWDVPDAKYLQEAPTGDYKASFCAAFCKVLFGREATAGDLKKYRKEFLVPLRKHIGIVESRLVKREYKEIEYSQVPSVAIKKYRKAFDRNDEERFGNFIEDVKSGKTKIKHSQVYPHDLVREYMYEIHTELDEVIEAQWKAIKEKVEASGAFKDSIVVCDVSGSMAGTPMEVAIALGLLGQYRNKVITFSANPKLHDIPQGTLKAQVDNIRGMEWGYNTDIVKVFDLVLDLSKQGGSPIRRLFIFSDMQFDEAISSDSSQHATHMELIRKRYANADITMPLIVFWNLRGNTNDFPVKQDDNGVVLLSGYSPSLLTSLVDGEIPSPLTIVLDIVNSKRYALIKEPVK